MGYYLAIDIGETTGRHILGHLENEKLQIEEVYWFENRTIEKDAEQYWDLQYVFEEILKGIIRCKEIGTLPILVGIDALGTDFVLLDEEDNVICDPHKGTGVTKQGYNLINGLADVKGNHPEYLKKAKTFLMIPDYFNFLLTGVKFCEYTGAAASQLLNPTTGVWDEEIIEGLGCMRDIFQEIRRPGAVLGNLTRAITEEVGYDCIIVLPATNAVSSAMFAFPPKDHMDLYQRSNVWPLISNSQADTESSGAVIGNLLIQMIISHEMKDVQSAIECAKNSFTVKNQI